MKLTNAAVAVVLICGSFAGSLFAQPLNAEHKAFQINKGIKSDAEWAHDVCLAITDAHSFMECIAGMMSSEGPGGFYELWAQFVSNDPVATSRLSTRNAEYYYQTAQDKAKALSLSLDQVCAIIGRPDCSTLSRLYQQWDTKHLE